MKTRLARSIGPIGAWRFHRQSLRSLLARLARVPRCRRWLVVTPDPRRPQSSGGWTVHGQGRGDLGARLERLLDRLPAGPVVIVGTDTPDVEASHAIAAFQALESADLAVGPASDGGYWLIGFGRRRRTFSFQGVRWSTAFALADTLAVAGNRTVARLAVLEDVDDAASHGRWRAKGRARPAIDRLVRPAALPRGAAL